MKATRRCGLPATLSVLLLVMTGSGARAMVVTLDSTADTRIQESEPDVAAGHLAILRVEGRIGTTHQAFLRWDVSSVDSNVVVNDVTFSAIQTDTFVGPGLLVHSIDQGDWDESSLTWNHWVTQTTGLTYLGLMPVNGSTTDGGRSTFRSPQLTALVQGWLDARIDNRGILLTFNGTSTGDTLASREHSTFDPPRLTIDYTVVPEPSAIILLAFGGLLLTLMLGTGHRRVVSSWGDEPR